VRPGSPRDACDADADVVTVYMAFLTDTLEVFLYDTGYCFDFVSTTAADRFSVFSLPGAPDPAGVVAIDWTGDTLMAFTAN
jgi:hypothetical protein